MVSTRIAAAAVGGLAALTLVGSATPAVAPSPSLMAGQMLMTSMPPGRTAPAAFLARVRTGQIGGVVLYNDNFGAAGPKAIIGQLKAAAAAGAQPPLLIAVDQEGGSVKRLGGAPTLAPPQMLTPSVARAQGQATAANLLRNGADVDLAPVLDVAHGGFITPRTFGATAADVATRATAFEAGLAQGGVFATGKHFPGLGYAPINTDNGASVVTASRAALLTDLLPYQVGIAAGLPIVMVSTAVYPRLGVEIPAACSSKIVGGLLRGRLGFKGLVLTDDLNTPGVRHFFPTPAAAVRAVGAGVDMVIATDASGPGVYAALVAAIRSGQIPAGVAAAAYGRVLALKT
jgi:beta-N-acetylhexosaminidase